MKLEHKPRYAVLKLGSKGQKILLPLDNKINQKNK